VGSYTAWVQAFDNTNQTKGWSAGYNFTISAPATPSGISPSGSITGTLPTFTWNAVTGAARYDLWVDDVTTGQGQVIRQQNLTDSSYTAVAALVQGHSYRIWLRALNANGDSSAWSTAVNFTIS
jgi:predicted phage tail protein